MVLGGSLAFSMVLTAWSLAFSLVPVWSLTYNLALTKWSLAFNLVPAV